MNITITNSGGREWLLARFQTERRLTCEEADATIAHFQRQLMADGWQVAGSSDGFGRFPGLYTIEIDGVRGDGPRTAAELHLQSTFTGRD